MFLGVSVLAIHLLTSYPNRVFERLRPRSVLALNLLELTYYPNAPALLALNLLELTYSSIF